jgi:phosphoribosylglycinamide formyltransferase 1
MFKLGWFSTGRGPGSRALLTAMCEAIQRGEINAAIEFVFCSREAGEAEGSDEYLRLVQHYGLPLITFSYQQFRKAHAVTGKPDKNALPQWRKEYDRGVMTRLEKFEADLCVMAGYMLVVSPEMCARFHFLNLHPATPRGPKGTWQEVIWELIRSGARETGVMMHLVTPELDRGPVVTYCTFPLSGGDFERDWQEIERGSFNEIKVKEGEANALFRLIRAEGVKRETPLILATIKAFSEGRVRLVGGRVYAADGHEVAGYDLTEDIEKMVRGSV